MRLVAATALVQLYAVDDHVPLLHKFTVRFASRYAEIIYDLSEAVSVKGVRASLDSTCSLAWTQNSQFRCFSVRGSFKIAT